MRAAAAICAAIFLCASAAPRAQLVESLTVTLLPNSVSFTLISNSSTNSGSTPIVATTSWTLLATRTNVSLYAYFSNATSALAHTAALNTVNIPSSRVQVSINGGPNTPLDQTVTFGGANAGLQVFSQPITALTLIGNRSDTLALNITLAGYSLPADTYSGGLRLRARATP